MTTTQPPEAAGPGTADASGGVAYGEAAQAGAQAFVPPPRDPAQRDADMAAARERARCDRCAALPDDLVAAINVALHAAHEAGRKGRPR